jgi:hypothetical protein
VFVFVAVPDPSGILAAEVAGQKSCCVARRLQRARTLPSDVHAEARRKRLIPDLDPE